MILAVRTTVGEEQFGAWAWRVAFLVSILLLAVSVWIRMKLHESPVFERIKSEGKTSKAPLTEAFGEWKNLKIVLLALFGLTAGQAVVWYTGQFYSLFFLTQTLKVDGTSANIMVAVALLIGTPFFRLLRLAVGSHRMQADHHGGLPDRGAIVLPPVQGTGALHESGDRSRDAKVADRRDRESGRVLVPVQSDGHVEIHEFVRYRQERAVEGRSEL